MGNETFGEKIGLKGKAAAALLVLLGGGALVGINAQIGAVDEVEPIKIPATAREASDKAASLKAFQVPPEDVNAVSCGKVVIKLGEDLVPTKSIPYISSDLVVVQCDTAGFDIPVERLPGN